MEWANAWARVRRWEEEKHLLTEEMRRTVVSLLFMAAVWHDRSNIPEFHGQHAEGAGAYAHRQAAMYRDLAREFAEKWGYQGVDWGKISKAVCGEVPGDEVEEGDPELSVDMEGGGASGAEDIR